MSKVRSVIKRGKRTSRPREQSSSANGELIDVPRTPSELAALLATAGLTITAETINREIEKGLLVTNGKLTLAVFAAHLLKRLGGK